MKSRADRCPSARRSLWKRTARRQHRTGRGDGLSPAVCAMPMILNRSSVPVHVETVAYLEAHERPTGCPCDRVACSWPATVGVGRDRVAAVSYQRPLSRSILGAAEQLVVISVKGVSELYGGSARDRATVRGAADAGPGPAPRARLPHMIRAAPAARGAGARPAETWRLDRWAGLGRRRWASSRWCVGVASGPGGRRQLAAVGVGCDPGLR